MPEDFAGSNPFDAWDDADRARLSAKMLRANENIKQAMLSGRGAELAPHFHAFFEFCRGRRFTAEGQEFVDDVRRMAATLDIGA